MRIHPYLLRGLLPVILLSGACGKKTGPDVAQSAKIVHNPGFESGEGSDAGAAGWSSTTGSANPDAAFIAKLGHTGSYALNQKSATAYQVQTTQDISNLPDGNYQLTAYTRNSGGQQACYLFAQTAAGRQVTSLPVSTGAWALVTVRGIKVINGTCSIGLYSDANAGDWCQMDDVSLTPDDAPYIFLKGGDVSELSYVESKGGKFYDNLRNEDCFQILKDKGFNIVRLRLYNDPGNPGYTPSKLLPAGFQDTTDILRLARRAAGAGMQILLTFHYSDYWTNPSTQTLPHQWAGLNFAQLKQAVYDFTFRFMQQMEAQQTPPQYVALGNETSTGFLFPFGDETHFDQMAALFNEGYEAVKAVSPSTKLIIHLDEAGDTAKYNWFFGALEAAGGKYDIIGASYYPFWSQKTVSEIQTWAQAEAARFGKNILLMETGYNWNKTLPDGSAGQLANNGPYQNVYPSSREGQKDFLYELFNGIKGVPGGCLIGDIYWDPVMLPAPGVGWELGQPDVVANSTLFDFSGNTLPAFSAFQYNN
jgi:arabinogalactan endo-1,4-beta-galactosidase